MFPQLLVLFIAIGAAVGDYADCLRLADSECLTDTFPREYPTTPEDLRRKCDDLKVGMKCYKDIYETCPEAEEDAVAYEFRLNATKETCNENSDIYKAISDHISCLGPLANGIADICAPWHTTEQESAVLGLSGDENYNRRMCRNHLQKITCNSVVASKRCGAHLKTIVANLERKFDPYYLKDCTPEILSELQPAAEAYENILMEKDFSTTV